MENKLKEALKKLGIETAEQLNAAIKAEKPLDYLQISFLSRWQIRH